jgi:teichuronic acid biosynthesis glycosyltransferase TuaC
LNTWPDQHPDRVPDLRAAIRAASVVIAVSAALAARVEAIAGTTALVLPLGSNHRSLAAFAATREQARADLGLVDGRIIVLFVGNLLAAKGVRELVDAVVSSGGRFLGVFVGDGPERGYGIDDPRGARCIQYRGARPHDEIAAYMSAADVLVLPSQREGLPTVLVEAGSLGLPVIASAVGGIPELLADGRGALLRDVTTEAIADALVAFETDRSAARTAAAKLRSHVLAEHDVDANADRLLDAYRSIRWPGAAQPGG